MTLRNTAERYGTVSILFHWILAILILGMLFLGWYITTLPKDLTRVKLLGLHKEIGITILFLVVFRMGWRINNISPSLSSLPLWERVSARTIHWLMYLLMVLIPLTGWIMTSFLGSSISYFGWFVIPNIVPMHKEWHHLFRNFHEWFAYSLLMIIVLSIIGLH